MAPSRGVSLFHTTTRIQSDSFRFHSRRYSEFVKAATNPSNKAQVYISRTFDPYLNLSIEHYLLQKTPAESTVLFLYTNRPCVVLGRNQNPWVEVNLGLLKDSSMVVDLVRRRSGGGTVFHDTGNVNYSVICPTPEFHRDKHAEMVVRALHKLGVKKTRVNERHDIVLDGEGLLPLKVSGSAYKLTRLRSLHHGTCLLSSPNLRKIGEYLRSPGKPFINARGVESVSSPVTNVNVTNKDFEEAVILKFIDMYGPVDQMTLSEGASSVPEIEKGLREIETLEWTFSQTPQFTFSAQVSNTVSGRSYSQESFTLATVC